MMNFNLFWLFIFMKYRTPFYILHQNLKNFGMALIARRGPPLVSSAPKATSSDVETQDAGSVGVNTEELSIASAREAGCERRLALNSSPSPSIPHLRRRVVVGGHCPRTCVRAPCFNFFVSTERNGHE